MAYRLIMGDGITILHRFSVFLGHRPRQLTQRTAGAQRRMHEAWHSDFLIHPFICA